VTDRRTDGRTDGIAIAYTRYSYAVARKNQSGFTGARDSEWQWHLLGYMQVCTPCRQLRQHPTTQFFTGRMPFLTPNQQHQSTEGTTVQKHVSKIHNKLTIALFINRKFDCTLNNLKRHHVHFPVNLNTLSYLLTD